jgi:hypothetical protein
MEPFPLPVRRHVSNKSEFMQYCEGVKLVRAVTFMRTHASEHMKTAAKLLQTYRDVLT